jgi:prevent-host-death family protein
LRTYQLHEARAAFSKLIERALEGEPQRVTRHGREAVVIISEADWTSRTKGGSTLADLLLKYAGSEGYGDVIAPDGDAAIAPMRPFGADFVDED